MDDVTDGAVVEIMVDAVMDGTVLTTEEITETMAIAEETVATVVEEADDDSLVLS